MDRKVHLLFTVIINRELSRGVKLVRNEIGKFRGFRIWILA